MLAWGIFLLNLQDKNMNNKIFEWAGVITAILYSLFVAMNIGIEFFGFCLLLISAILIGIWLIEVVIEEYYFYNSSMLQPELSECLDGFS